MRHGGVAEWLKAPVLKTGRDESPSWVRIPPPPHPSLRSRENCDLRREMPACTAFSEAKVPQRELHWRGRATICRDSLCFHFSEGTLKFVAKLKVPREFELTALRTRV